MKRKRLPRLAALTIVLLLVIQSLPALAFTTNPADTSGAGTSAAVFAEDTENATEVSTQENSDSVEAADEEDNVREFTYTMHNHYWTSPTVIGEANNIPDADGTVGSRSINFAMLNSSFFPALYQQLKDNQDYKDLDACYEFLRSRTIVSWDCGKDYDTDDNGNRSYYNSLIAPSYFVFRDNSSIDPTNLDGLLSGEILNCANENGLDWSNDTELSNLTAEFYNDLYFYDENGDPADFIRKKEDGSERYWDWWAQPRNNGKGKFTDTTNGPESCVCSPSSITQAWTGIRYMDNENKEVSNLTFDQISPIEMISGSTANGYYFNRNYLGKLIVKPEMRLVFHFTVDGQKYQFTLKTPDMPNEFEVVRGEYTHTVETPDSDVKAAITHDGSSSELGTEHEQVTAVQHDDKIAYQIDFSSEAEAEVFYQLQNAICKMSGFYFTDEDEKKLEDIGVIFPQPYVDHWMGDNNGWTEEPRIKVDFTIPRELSADEINVNDISLSQEGESSLQWKIDTEKTTYTQNETSSVIHVELVLPDEFDLSELIENFPMDNNGNKIDLSSQAELMNQIRSDKLTLNIPEITVSKNAKAGKYYTAKAKISGHLHMDYEAIQGTSTPEPEPEPELEAKPTDGSEWDNTDTGWDDDTVSQTTTQSSPVKVSALNLLKALSVSNTDSSESVSTQDTVSAAAASDSSVDQVYSASDFQYGVRGTDYDERDLAPSLDYTSNHLQNDEGRDVIQSAEEAAETQELWYTVVIPAATISKELPDDASEEDLSKEFTFGIQLEDEDLFGQSFDAARGTKQDDGTISYSDTAETVSFDENGYAEISLKAGEVLAIGLPDGCEYTVKEILDDDSYTVEYKNVSSDGTETVSTGTYSNNEGITGKVEAAKYTESDSVDAIDVTATNYPKGNLAISKRVNVPEEELAAEENKVFSFVLTLDNDDFDVNRDYTVKLYSGGVYNSSLGRFEYQDDPTEETLTIQDGKFSFSLKHGQTLEIDGLSEGTSYTVEEVVNQGFTPSYKNQSGTIQAHDTTYALCENTYDYNETTDITVNKVWAGDTESSRPASVQAQLYRNGRTYGDPVTLKKSNDWSYTWYNLDADQKYTVAEVNVPDGYDSSVTNENNVWTITNTNQNTVTPDTHSVKVNKVWANDDSSTRPSSVQMQLYQNGSVYGDAVTLSETNDWSYTWTGLESGKNYTVAEVDVPDGYESSVTSADNVWTVTNTKSDTTTTDTNSVKVNKVWANDDSSTRPSSVKMQLYQNGSVYGDPVTLSETNDWSYTWTGLQEDRNYTVAEVDVPDGYESSVTSAGNVWTVTNTKKDTDTDTPSDNTTGNPSNTTTNTPSNTTTNTTTDTTSNNTSEPAKDTYDSSVKTGDTSSAGIWLLIILAASAGAIFAVVKKRANR